MSDLSFQDVCFHRESVYKTRGGAVALIIHSISPSRVSLLGGG